MGLSMGLNCFFNCKRQPDKCFTVASIMVIMFCTLLYFISLQDGKKGFINSCFCDIILNRMIGL
jgi:hypothetical protein